MKSEDKNSLRDSKPIQSIAELAIYLTKNKPNGGSVNK
jgi:hypothetical protein